MTGSPGAGVKVSVVVCTYNRADRLPLCLDSLARQTLDASAFEVLVVDNNSTDRTPDIVRAAAAARPNVRGLTEPRQGAALARNTGLSAAAGEVCAFIDDDAIAPPDWLERYERAFAAVTPDTVAIGGEINALWEAPRPPWLTNNLLPYLSACVSFDRTPRYIDQRQWIIECNCAYRRETFLQYGGFTAALGRRGTSLVSGENLVNKIMQARGLRIFYEPSIVVDHLIPAARMNKAWFRSRLFWQGVTHWLEEAYAAEQKVEIPGLPRIPVPADEASWRALFNDRDYQAFASSLPRLIGLGYVLARGGLVG